MEQHMQSSRDCHSNVNANKSDNNILFRLKLNYQAVWFAEKAG